MATFGTLDGELDAELRAVSACMDFITAIDTMNIERIKLRKEPIIVGVGVNTGTCYTIIRNILQANCWLDSQVARKDWNTLVLAIL